MRRDIKIQIPAITLALFGLSFGASPIAASDDEGAYGYFRTVEGSATVRGLDETYDAEVNRPLLTSDVLRTRFGSRVEVVLPDATRVRVGPDAEVVFDQMAYSADQWTDTTVLALQHGAMVVTIPEERPIEASTRIDAPNATFYLDEPGSYTVEARGYVTQIVVRQGFAEALTREGTHRLRAGEHAWIEGTEWPQVEIRRAGSRDELERWAYDLDLEAARYAARSGGYVEGSLGYSTSRLDRYGSWHRDGGRAYWRPTHVSSTWRPYDDGYWVHTPSGLTWVSYEPWGWATYHYGTWDFHSRFGWVWYPGYRYAPAWVYWYWGPRYVGWCPVGYYTSYYGYGHRSYYRGFGIGIYGWAGGHRSHWKHWNFVDGDRLGDRRLARHTRPGAHLQAVQDHLDRGIITTDTSVLGRDAIRQPRAAIQVLEGAKRTRAGGELPDLTDFVARKDIPSDMKRVAMPVREPGDAATSPRAVSVTTRPRDSGAATERGSDARGIRAVTPTGVRGGPATTPSTAEPRSDATPRSRTVAPRNPDGGEAREPRPVIQARPSEGVRTGSGADGEWRSRAAQPPRARTQDRPAVSERPGTRSTSPARRVLEGVRSDRSASPPAGARQSTPPPARSESGSPDRATTRPAAPRQSAGSASPSTSPRSTTPRPSTRSSSPPTSSRSTAPPPSARSSSPSTSQRSTAARPSASSGSTPQATTPRSSTSSSKPSSSSVRPRSTSSPNSSSSSASQRSSSSSRSTATRGSSGSSSRGTSRSTAQRSRSSSDPDR